MLIVTLHHFLIALLVCGLFTFFLKRAADVVAERHDYLPLRGTGALLPLAALACGMATAISCALYISSPWIRSSPGAQTVLVALSALSGVMLVGRSMDRRVVTLLGGFLGTALAALLVGLYHPLFNLQNFLAIAGVGFASLLRIPAPEFQFAWWTRITERFQEIFASRAGRTPPPEGAPAPVPEERSKVPTGRSRYPLRPDYDE